MKGLGARGRCLCLSRPEGRLLGARGCLAATSTRHDREGLDGPKTTRCALRPWLPRGPVLAISRARHHDAIAAMPGTHIRASPRLDAASRGDERTKIDAEKTWRKRQPPTETRTLALSKDARIKWNGSEGATARRQRKLRRVHNCVQGNQ